MLTDEPTATFVIGSDLPNRNAIGNLSDDDTRDIADCQFVRVIAGTDKDNAIGLLTAVKFLNDIASLFSVTAYVNKNTKALLVKEVGKFQDSSADEQGIMAGWAEKGNALEFGNARP